MCITLKSFLLVLPLSLFVFLKVVAQDVNKSQLAREYYDNGEIEKARNTYEQLARNKKNIPFIHKIYFELLLNENDFKTAEKYIQQLEKWFPDNLNYEVDHGSIYLRSDNEKKANDIFEQTIRKADSNPVLTRSLAQYFFQQGLPDYAVRLYLSARKKSGNKADFSMELANIYRRINNKQGMIDEYLNYINEHPTNLNYVQNVMQNLLTETEDLEALEQLLYDKIQDAPNNVVYNDLLIWVSLQLENFYGAFVQARALDKRYKEGGNRLLDIGLISLKNSDYDVAEQIFAYVIKTYPSGVNHEIARRYLIMSREEIVKKTYPVDTASIKMLIDDYDGLISDLGVNQITLEAIRSKALLHAFYLNQLDTAALLLKKVISTPRTDPELLAQSKLDLGDIYLLKNEPWESTLLYSQVEKSAKETVLGYQAKLKNAKLSYYKGDFELAQAHLDVLKLATTREIANDAMALSLLIQDNTALDTSENAMRDYAAIDLLLFQNRKLEAIDHLNKMLASYPGHSLTDEIWWRKAEVLMELGRFEEAITFLDQIVNAYPYDILSDDAHFLMATILEDHLGRKEKAMEIYQSLLTKYPGSLYTAESRKRFRALRGDFGKKAEFPLNN